MTIDDHIPNTAKPTKTHPDDVAVDNFAVAMKEKLAIARGRGRSGWGKCDPAHLSAMLYEHVQKGDPRDVANFCMFLWNLGQPITPCKPTQAEPVAYFCEWDGWTQYHDERDPLPDKWDDAPKKITPLYTHPAPAVAQEPVVQRTLGYEQGIQDAAKMLDTKANDYAKEFGFDDMGALEFSRESQREYHSTLVELAEEVRSMEATNSAPAVAQSWELNEETAKFLADLILANDKPTPVTLSVGFIKDDDGKIQHGLRVHESEYPEEGAELLVESTPSPQKAPPVEVVRDAILGVQCAAELLEALPSLIETNVEVHAQIHETYEFLKGVLQTAKEHGL